MRIPFPIIPLLDLFGVNTSLRLHAGGLIRSLLAPLGGGDSGLSILGLWVLPLLLESSLLVTSSHSPAHCGVIAVGVVVGMDKAGELLDPCWGPGETGGRIGVGCSLAVGLGLHSPHTLAHLAANAWGGVDWLGRAGEKSTNPCWGPGGSEGRTEVG